MFPISDSIHSNSFPFVNVGLILLTIVVFFQQLTSPESFTLTYALIPATVHVSNPVSLIPFITAIFLHGGFLHIITNMWFLWVFGDDVEAYFGHITYLFLYIFSGVIGNVVQYLISAQSTIPLVGASGAIAGILGSYFILFPQSKVKTLVPIFFFVTFIDIPAYIMLGYWAVLQLFSGANSLGASAGGGVAFFAHVGGFMTGMLFAVFMRNPKREGVIWM